MDGEREAMNENGGMTAEEEKDHWPEKEKKRDRPRLDNVRSGERERE